MNSTHLFFLITVCVAPISGGMEHPQKSQSEPMITIKSPRTLVTLPRPLSLTAQSEVSTLLNPFIAVRKKNLEELKRIVRIKYIFDANMQEEETGQTLLHYCVFNKDENTIKFLILEKKANPLIKNNAGKSALDTAAEYEFTHITSVINECLRDDLYAHAHSSIKIKTKEGYA